MFSSIWNKVVQFLQPRKHKVYVTVFVCLAVLVAAGTVTVLRLQSQAMNYTKRVLDCQLQVHKHTKDCYKEDENGEKYLVCGLADYVVHVHNADCYDESGALVCKLPEIPEHKHTEDCYIEQTIQTCTLEETPGHQHTDACYKEEKGELTCKLEEHTHSDECKDENGELICGKEEHAHTDACYAVNKVLICGKEQGEGAHTHDPEKCFKTEKVLNCGLLEMHTHDPEKCYKTEKDGTKTLTCTRIVLEEHVHTADCFVEVELSPEEVAAMNQQQAQPAPEQPQPAEGEQQQPAEQQGEQQPEGQPAEQGQQPEQQGQQQSAEQPSGEQQPETAAPNGEQPADSEKPQPTPEPGEPEPSPSTVTVGEPGEKVYRDDTIVIIATYEAEAMIPSNAELRAYPVTAESDPERYAQRMEEAKRIYDEKNGTQTNTEDLQSAIYNIGFFVGDEEVEPAAPVTLTIQFLGDDGLTVGDPITVILFSDGTAEVLDVAPVNEEGEASFVTKGF